MNKNYANNSDVIKVGVNETMVVYSEACDNVVFLFHNKKAAAGLSSINAPVYMRKDIVDKCSELGLPGKIIYTEIEGCQEKYFRADNNKVDNELVVKQTRIKGKAVLVVETPIQKELGF